MAVHLIKRGALEQARVEPLLIREHPVLESPDERGSAASAQSAPGGEPMPAVAHDPGPGVDLAQLERSAFENGFRQGEKAGLEIAEKRVEAMMRRYGDAILELGRAKSAAYREVERDVVRLALEVARNIVHREVQVDPEIVQTLVRVALSHVAERSPVTVRVHPLDYAFLTEKHPGWVEEAAEGRQVAIVADKTIERGGCVVQTDCGDIDARIEEEFREVERAFFEGPGQAEP